MAGATSRQNGKKGGRPKGRKNDKTLELEKEREVLHQLILAQLQPLFDAQLSLAKGVSYVFRVRIGPRGGQGDPELVTDPDELHEAIQAIQSGESFGETDAEDEDGEKVTNRYYHITTKLPDGRAIENLYDRVFGKPTQTFAGDKDNPIYIKGVTVKVARK